MRSLSTTDFLGRILFSYIISHRSFVKESQEAISMTYHLDIVMGLNIDYGLQEGQTQNHLSQKEGINTITKGTQINQFKIP